MFKTDTSYYEETLERLQPRSIFAYVYPINHAHHNLASLLPFLAVTITSSLPGSDPEFFRASTK